MSDQFLVTLDVFERRIRDLSHSIDDTLRKAYVEAYGTQLMAPPMSPVVHWTTAMEHNTHHAVVALPMKEAARQPSIVADTVTRHWTTAMEHNSYPMKEATRATERVVPQQEPTRAREVVVPRRSSEGPRVVCPEEFRAEGVLVSNLAFTVFRPTTVSAPPKPRSLKPPMPSPERPSSRPPRPVVAAVAPLLPRRQVSPIATPRDPWQMEVSVMPRDFERRAAIPSAPHAAPKPFVQAVPWNFCVSDALEVRQRKERSASPEAIKAAVVASAPPSPPLQAPDADVSTTYDLVVARARPSRPLPSPVVVVEASNPVSTLTTTDLSLDGSPYDLPPESPLPSAVVIQRSHAVNDRSSSDRTTNSEPTRTEHMYNTRGRQTSPVPLHPRSAMYSNPRSTPRDPSPTTWATHPYVTELLAGVPMLKHNNRKPGHAWRTVSLSPDMECLVWHSPMGVTVVHLNHLRSLCYPFGGIFSLKRYRALSAAEIARGIVTRAEVQPVLAMLRRETADLRTTTPVSFSRSDAIRQGAPYRVTLLLNHRTVVLEASDRHRMVRFVVAVCRVMWCGLGAPGFHRVTVGRVLWMLAAYRYQQFKLLGSLRY